MEIDQKIELLEKEVQEIKTKGKDFWDILKIAGGLLIPATIAFVGLQYSNAMKNAEIKSATNIAQLQLEFSKQTADFDQKISETNSVGV